MCCSINRRPSTLEIIINPIHRYLMVENTMIESMVDFIERKTFIEDDTEPPDFIGTIVVWVPSFRNMVSKTVGNFPIAIYPHELITHFFSLHSTNITGISFGSSLLTPRLSIALPCGIAYPLTLIRVLVKI